MVNDVQAKRCILFSGLRMVYERSVNPMKRFKVVCIGYKKTKQRENKGSFEI